MVEEEVVIPVIAQDREVAVVAELVLDLVIGGSRAASVRLRRRLTSGLGGIGWLITPGNVIFGLSGRVQGLSDSIGHHLGALALVQVVEVGRLA
ncbi:hypothetical protein D3C79_831230 [compost metagenome]